MRSRGNRTRRDASADKGSRPVGDRIRRVREVIGADRSEFARVLGVHPGSVARWESGGAAPRPYYMREIAELGGVSLGWLQYGEGSGPESGRPRQPQVSASGAPRDMDQAGPLVTEEIVVRFIERLGLPGTERSRKLDALNAYRLLITLQTPVPPWWYSLEQRVHRGDL